MYAKKVAASLFLLFLFTVPSLMAQKDIAPNLKGVSKMDQKKLNDAEYFYGEDRPLRALPLYTELSNNYPDQLYFKYKMGICLLYKADEKDKSIDILKSITEAVPDFNDAYFFLGRAYHLNYKFDEAIATFNKYLATNPSVNQRLLTNKYIENSKNGKAIIEIKVRCEIKNIGSPINTENQEYVPVISSDESVLIYTYVGPLSTGGLMDDDLNPDPNGNYYEDVFISHRVGDEWLAPESIGENINTKNHDASIALSADGQQLFLFHSTPEDGGDIYLSQLKGEVWGEPEPLGPMINTKYWEGSASLSADEQKLYFASERPGGLGGRDIYVSEKQSDGSWGKAVNLGSSINTRFNDDAPFIHPDGITLFFSSEGHNSIGGYDIMYSTLKDKKWSEPVNLGSPINTPEDERYYVLTADGEHGYFSSDRKGGAGQQDIYSVTPGYFGDKPVLALVVGTVSADDKPVNAKISVTNAETGEKQGEYHSNSSSGKYIIALTPGNNYKVAIEVEGYEAQYQYVNVKNLDTYVQVQKDFKLYSDGYRKSSGITAVQDSSNVLQDQINQQLKRYNEEKKAEVYEARVYQELLKKYGDVRNECVSYNVELGTFENAADFNPAKLTDIGGDIQQRKDDKGNTTFYYANFKTMLDAEIFKYRVVEKDTSLKNIIVTVKDCNGERRLIQQYYQSEYTRKDYTPPADSKVIANKGMVALTSGDVLKDAVKDNGTSEIAGLTFKVEIGAVDNPADFKLDYLKKYGKIESKKYPDGKTRYTFGPFKTLAEAEAFRKNLVEKESEASEAFVTVFFFGARKTLDEYKNPCDTGQPGDFSAFIGKDLNDKEVYNKLIGMAGGICAEGLVFTVQIGAYRHPENFKHKNLNSLEPPKAKVAPFPDGITRFTMREFTTLKDAEIFRQEAIRLGTKDAWITGYYNGKRMLLQELIANNFFGKQVN